MKEYTYVLVITSEDKRLDEKLCVDDELNLKACAVPPKDKHGRKSIELRGEIDLWAKVVEVKGRN